MTANRFGRPSVLGLALADLVGMEQRDLPDFDCDIASLDLPDE